MALHVTGVVNDVADSASLVDDECNPSIGLAVLIVDAKGLGRMMFWIIGADGIRDPTMVGEGLLRRVEIRAGCDNLRVQLFKLC